MSATSQRRIASGQCVGCGGEPANGTQMCLPCTDVSRKRQIQRFRSRKFFGLCGHCGKVKGTDEKLVNCDECSAGIKERVRNDNFQLKAEVFMAYGGICCACCGETTVEFLSIDHIDGGGSRHRKEIGGGGRFLYKWLKRNGYPPGYRVLCMNCNFGRRFGKDGRCPHEELEISREKC